MDSLWNRKNTERRKTSQGLSVSSSGLKAGSAIHFRFANEGAIKNENDIFDENFSRKLLAKNFLKHLFDSALEVVKGSREVRQKKYMI